MSTYQVVPMIYDSKEQIEAIILLEQQCKQLDTIHLKADLDHISKKTETMHSSVIMTVNWQDSSVGMLLTS
ncbi:hypothetical protein Q0F98_15870 [Paenibacillus amylolyticus]|nr:hypothetical protein Q0F98_15870 [Paenibacillus amylolyticus]